MSPRGGSAVRPRNRIRKRFPPMRTLQAVFFDQEGVIVDTEPAGLRVAFGQAFREFGLPYAWGLARCAERLQMSGGKERWRHFFRQEGAWAAGCPTPALEELIQGRRRQPKPPMTTTSARGRAAPNSAKG